MNRFSWRFDNGWRWLRDGGSLDLLRVSATNDVMHAAIGVSLLGFGLGLTYWKRPAREWEPIETDGWAGEPQGMEKAP